VTLNRTGELKRGVPLKAKKRIAPVSSRRREQSVAEKDARWRDTVLWRDKGECQARRMWREVKCFGAVQAHHIAPKKNWPELRHDPVNGIGLCLAHHNAVHDGDPQRARRLKLLV
jgi:hypothetical protein